LEEFMRKPNAIFLISGLAVALFLGAGCDVDRRSDTAIAPGSPTPAVTATPYPGATEATPFPGATAANVSLTEINRDWSKYDGKTVTVVGEVDELLGPRAFKLDEDSALEDDDDILVLSPKSGAVADIDEHWLNNKVRVTGVVRRFETANIEREIDWDLDPRIEAEYEGKSLVLIATSVERQ
jgi:hypothetical protein